MLEKREIEMKLIPIAAVILTTGIFLSSCTTTETSNNQVLPVASSQVIYLTADQIRETIIGNTMAGTANFSSVGNVPFKMYFEQGTGIYRDRAVVRKNPSTAFGTYRITEDGQLCRISKSRAKGAETCWRFSNSEKGYILTGPNGSIPVSITSGNAI